jgi:hypothetical protein
MMEGSYDADMGSRRKPRFRKFHVPNLEVRDVVVYDQ